MTEKAERTIEKKWFKKAINFGLVAVFALVFFFLNSAPADAGNQQITFQGKLTNSSGNVVSNGTYYVKLTIWDAASGGSCQYTASSTCASVTSTPVTVTNGIFSINLGDTSASLAAISPTLFNSSALYLGITVCSGAGTGCDSEMTPRKRITAAPYAFNADYLSGLATSTIGGQSSYVPVTDSSGNFTISNKVFVATTTAGQFGVGTSTVPSGVKSYVEGTTATDKLLVLRGNSSQSGNLQEWQNSAGTALMSINFSGNVSTSGSLRTYGNVTSTGHIYPASNNAVDFGAYGSAFRNTYASGTLYASSTLIGFGTAGAPTYSFAGDADTGMYRSAADTLSFSVGGTRRAFIDSNGVNVTNAVIVDGVSTYTAASLTLSGGLADSATAIGVQIGNSQALATAGAKIVSFYSDGFTTEKAFVDVNGYFNVKGGSGASSTFANNSLKLNISSGYNSGLFNVDSSGNTSASGSLVTFGNVTSTGNLYALSGSASTSIINGSSLTLGQGTGYNSGMFNVNSNGNVSASGTLNVSSTIKIDNTQVVYLPDQTTFVGTLVLGSGGRSLTGTGSQGDGNTFVGLLAGFANTTGGGNTASGYSALISNTTGGGNSAYGYQALSGNIGSANTAIGQSALGGITTGGDNTALGYYAGYNEDVSAFSTASSTFLGMYTSVSMDGLKNVIVIGYNAQGTASNQVVLGNTSITQTLLRGNVGIGYNSPSDKLTVYGGNLRVGNGTVSSTLGANFFAVATSTTNMNGLFYVDSSGNTSVSGTLTTFGAVILGDSIADNILIVGALSRPLYISDNISATTTISNIDFVLNKSSGYNSGVFNIDSTGSVNASGTITTASSLVSAGFTSSGAVTITGANGINNYGNTTLGNSDAAGGDWTYVYGTMSMGIAPTGNAQMYLKASSTTAVPLLIQDNSGNTIGQFSSSSVDAIVGGAQVTLNGYSVLSLGNAGGRAGALSIRAVDSSSPGAIIVYRDASAVGAQLTPGTLIVSGGGSGSTSTLDSLSLTLTQKVSYNQGVFYVDSNGNTSVSGTTKIFGGASTGGFNVTATNTTTTLTSSATSTNGVGAGAFVLDTNSPFNSVVLNQNILLSIRNNGTAKFSFDGNGNAKASGGFTAGGPGDLAEVVDLVPGEEAEAGDVVVVDSNGLNQYRKSTSAYASNIAGVFSDTGRFIVGEPGAGKVTLALAGLVKTKVSDENGPINAGDYLVSASLPGYAMKYDATSLPAGGAGIVGMALEPLAAGEGKIMILVNKSPINSGSAAGLNVSQNSSGQLVQNNDLDMAGKSIFNLLTIKSKDNKWMIDEDGYLIVKITTKQGDKKLYGLQSGQDKELVLSGSSQLENGLKKIELPLIDQEVIDTTSTIKVSVTLTGEAKGVFVSEKNYQGFTVKELGGGTSNATFDWMLIAKRRATDPTATEPESAPIEPSAPVAPEVASSTPSEESAPTPTPVETTVETLPDTSPTPEAPAPAAEPIVPPAE